MLLLIDNVGFKHSSAATNLDNQRLDPKLIPVDWTPEKGYANESIKAISMPRPALGNRMEFMKV